MEHVELLSNAKAPRDAFVTAKYAMYCWPNEFHGLVVYWDEEYQTFITRLEFEFMHLYLHAFELGETGLGVTELIDLLALSGFPMELATAEVKLSDIYLSVERMPRPSRHVLAEKKKVPRRSTLVTRDPKEGLSIGPTPKPWLLPKGNFRPPNLLPKGGIG